MNKKAYREALGYAYKFQPIYYRDIVHDSWLTWYKKTGKDLFDEHRGVISQVVKNQYLSDYITRVRYQKDGVKYYREFYPVEDWYKITNFTPLDELIFNDNLNYISNHIQGDNKRLLTSLINKYDNIKLAKQYGVSRQLMYSRTNKLKETIKKVVI